MPKLKSEKFPLKKYIYLHVYDKLAMPRRKTVCFYPKRQQIKKMAAPTEFTLESVREFMLEKGGKVTNHELVKHFKQFLTDPYTKGNFSIKG